MVATDYAARVLAVLQAGPTNADLNFLVEAYTNLGYLAAQAQGEAEMAEARRKYEEANAYRTAKMSGEKVTERQAEAEAAVSTWDFRQAEVEARTRARKLQNLLDSTEQAINAIKFLGRYDAPVRVP